MESDSEKSRDLKFRPMNPGLGFHPFSNGLPYQASNTPSAPLPPARTIAPAPLKPPAGPILRASPPPTAAKAPSTGAMSAGRPRFAFPNETVAMPAAKPVTAKAAPAVVAATQERPGVMYLFKRAAAYVADSVINVGSVAGTFMFAATQMGLDPAGLIHRTDTLLVTSLFLFCFNWALITGQEIAFGTSLGKRAFGLELDRSRMAAVFLRSFFFVFSLGFFGLGLIWAFFDRDRRCWHDWLADMAPREVARL
ncbi:MAG TPA: RDD family protein [Bdellovibrionota bacterium]|nr:RDD family protein [Bdellovibrionota bacterium]